MTPWDALARVVPQGDTATLAVALVVVLVLARLYLGSTLLSLRFALFWATARRLYMPVVDRLAKRAAGVSAENRATREEWVADVDASLTETIRGIERASAPAYQFEVSVLSGLKSDWRDNVEAASIVAYAGPKPFPGAPRFLRREQVHVFMFRTEGELTRVCAHYEANAYRPDLWRDHLRKGETFDAAKGVDMVREWIAESGVGLPSA